MGSTRRDEEGAGGGTTSHEPSPHLDVVAAPGVLGDVRTAQEVLQRALARRGARGSLLLPPDAAALRTCLARAAGRGEFVHLPADPADLDAQDLPGAPASVLRVDLGPRPADRSRGVRCHVRGRGLAGIGHAVDAWHFHRAHPARRLRYGPDPDQHVELRLPAGAGPHPVAVLVHGGYWRSRWQADLMDAMAVDLAARGLATWNVEYRRPDDSSWDATTADVAAAVRLLRDPQVATDLDPGRVVLLGHSAGGQLVTRLAADLAADPAGTRPALTVSLAGVLDLRTADRRWLGEGAVSTALRARWAQDPQLYRRSSPLERLPIGSPLAVVCGRQDSADLLDISRAFAAAARAAGDDVVEVEEEGDHFSVIDPDSTAWARVADLVASRTAVPAAVPAAGSTAPVPGGTVLR